MQRYDKLVRDLIPERLRAQGVPCKFHVSDEQEYWTKLKDKLIEETNEFREAENLEELADLLEVIDAVIERCGFDRAELIAIKEKKAIERGRFRERLILEES